MSRLASRCSISPVLRLLALAVALAALAAANARAADSPAPRVNGPAVYGVRPGAPFLYTIPATGEPPLRFAVEPLPAGLRVDANTGRIEGRLAEPGERVVSLVARNRHGESRRRFRIVVGDRIALTPPMGWNTWYCWSVAIDDQKIRDAADAMVSSGLAAHGWTYLLIDDAWQGRRNPDGSLNPKQRFPDMRALGDYIHSRGLKFGIYSSPGPRTCAGYQGSYGHEEQDARTYAEWGVDYLKYDWCSYATLVGDPPSKEELMRPWPVMRRALDRVDRDIVYALCQYGMGDVWEWGDSVGANVWRTTGDIDDTWESVAGIGFDLQAGLAPHARPGCWNDPDILMVGTLGGGLGSEPTRLSKDEQRAHMSLWCLLSAPLMIGSDLTRMDEFTLSLLTNDDVIAVNQDALGRQAARAARDGHGGEVWAKDLDGGAKAVGLFNRSEAPRVVEATWHALGLKAPRRARDLWTGEDLGLARDAISRRVPAHGVALLRLEP